jgi:hypothetical protein
MVRVIILAGGAGRKVFAVLSDRLFLAKLNNLQVLDEVMHSVRTRDPLDVSWCAYV